jgi:hypothetical protein
MIFPFKFFSIGLYAAQLLKAQQTAFVTQRNEKKERSARAKAD